MKDTIRQQVISARENQNREEKARKETLIIQILTDLPEYKNAQTVLLYASFRGEVSMRAVKEDALKHKKLVLPTVEKETHSLLLHHVVNLDHLESGYAGILESPEHFDLVNPADIDFAVVPGVAFDRNGNRIGFGKGFYDRLLTQLNCPIATVAFDFQLFDTVPHEAHDHPLDIIITEKETLRFDH